MEFIIILDGEVIDSTTNEAIAQRLVVQYNEQYNTNDVDIVTLEPVFFH